MPFILAVSATVKTPRKSRKRKAPTPSAKLQAHLQQREEEKQETSSEQKSSEQEKSSEQKSSEQEKSSEQKSSEQEKSNEQKLREPKEIIITAIRIVRRYYDDTNDMYNVSKDLSIS